MGIEFQSNFDKTQGALQLCPRHGELDQSFLVQHILKPKEKHNP